MKQEDLKAKEENLMTEFYNLLLNPDIKADERQVLLDYKQDLADGADFSRATYILMRNLQRLSVSYMQSKEKLSQPTQAFYQTLDDYQKAELKQNKLSKGFMLSSGTWLRQ